MRRSPSAQALGHVSHWDAAKGLGFVQPEAGGERLLLRRADLRGRLQARGQPRLHERVRFHAAQGMAREVFTLEAPAPAPAPPPGAAPAPAPSPAALGSARLLLIPAFALLLAAVHTLWPLPRALTLVYGALSTALFIVYGMDKWAARKGQARVAEASLHLIALLGGWPGALLGQQVFRHKTRKSAFLRWTWAMVALNLLAFVALFTPLLA